MLHSWGFNEKLPTGKGLVVLLSGEPGTGKTLAAEVIGAELGLSLYRVNPAKVVSKFVGETEKNLNEILAQAQVDALDPVLRRGGRAVLGARRQGRDRQRPLRQHGDELPVPAARALRGHRHPGDQPRDLDRSGVQAPHRLPRGVRSRSRPIASASGARSSRRARPSRQIDFARLGKTFELSGGHIKNAVLRAAYTAAQRNNTSITILAEAAEKECAAAGKLFQNPGIHRPQTAQAAPLADDEQLFDRR